MDKIFERLTNLFKSFVNDLTGEEDNTGTNRKTYVDPDEQDAWEELNDYLNDDDTTDRQHSSSSRQHSYTGSHSGSPDNKLQQDFKNLEVPNGASFEEVKKAYKNLLRKYHPDKHANDPEKQKFATEYTKKINESYLRIKNYYQKK